MLGGYIGVGIFAIVTGVLLRLSLPRATPVACTITAVSGLVGGEFGAWLGPTDEYTNWLFGFLFAGAFIAGACFLAAWRHDELPRRPRTVYLGRQSPRRTSRRTLLDTPSPAPENTPARIGRPGPISVSELLATGAGADTPYGDLPFPLPVEQVTPSQPESPAADTE
jgi:hypothetical protein